MAYSQAFDDQINEPELYRVLSDDDLIDKYKSETNQYYFEALLNRHKKRVLGRVYANVRSKDDVRDIVQLVWINLINRLESYQGVGKFSHYLNVIITNTINDYYREKKTKNSIISDNKELDLEQIEKTPAQDNVEQELINKEKFEILIFQVIPQLSVEHRTVFLLRHEFDHWEQKKSLSWNAIAVLNGMTEAEAKKGFDEVRGQLTDAAYSGHRHEMNPDNLLVYLLWVQSQKPKDTKEMKWQDLSRLLGVSENALKLRYRTAIKEIKRRLDEVYGNGINNQ